MKFRALVAVLGLVVACTAGADLNSTQQVQQPAFSVEHMQMKVVADGHTTLQQLIDKTVLPDGLAAEIDRWKTPEGNEVTDLYLSAPSRQALEHYTAQLTLPPDREIAFEKLDNGRWRSFLLEKTVELDASAVASTHTGVDPNTGRPIVELDFTPAGAQHFAELSTRISGHKLAVLENGVVIQAPIVNGPITGGHAQITVR